LKAGVLLSYASNIQRKLSIVFFLLKSAICQVKLCSFMIVYHTTMGISRTHSFRQFSLIFLGDIISLFSYVVKPTIVLIISHFVNFGKILEKYQNSKKRANSTARLKIPRPV